MILQWYVHELPAWYTAFHAERPGSSWINHRIMTHNLWVYRRYPLICYPLICWFRRNLNFFFKQKNFKQFFFLFFCKKRSYLWLNFLLFFFFVFLRCFRRDWDLLNFDVFIIFSVFSSSSSSFNFSIRLSNFASSSASSASLKLW